MLILSILLIFVNYQFFLASLLIYGLILNFLILISKRKDVIGKSLMLLIILLLFDTFASLFDINLYNKKSYISYLPVYSLQLNSNYHIYFLWGLSNSVSWLHYIHFAINHFSFAFLLGSWNFNYIFFNNIIYQDYFNILIFYFSIVNLISAFPFLALNFNKKLNILILSYFSLIIIITFLGPQLSIWSAETYTEIGNIVSFAFDAPLYYEPLLQILISIIAPLAILIFYKLYIRNINYIFTFIFLLMIMLSISSYEFFVVTTYKVNFNINQTNDILSYLETLGFPKTYFLLKNDTPQNFYLVSLYPNNQYYYGIYNETYLYYIIGYTIGYPSFPTLNCQSNPRILNYVLNYFGFKYIVTDQKYLAEMYNDSKLFKIIYQNNYYFILKIKYLNYNISDILLTTSTRILTTLLNNNNTYPLWLNQPYLYNIILIADLAKNHTIYVPWYFNIYELYTYIPDKYVIDFAHYDVNFFNDYEWKAAFSDFDPQQEWGINYYLFNNYQYQNFIAPNYGTISADNPNVIFKMNYNIPNGKYVVITQILYSNIGGKVVFSINNRTFIISTKTNNGSYFAFTYLGEINVTNNSLKIKIINKSGFNAIDVMYILPYNTYIKYYDELNNLVNTFKKIY